MFIVPGAAKAVQQAKSIVIYVDGTYKTAPSIFAQLIMAYAEIDGKVLPLAFMPTTVTAPDSGLYQQVLTKLKTCVSPMNVEKTVSDFEKALINGLRTVFPEATHQGCLFHFKQAIKQYIVTKLKIQPTDSDYVKYRIAMQLAHLPAAKIQQGMDLAIENIAKSTADQEKAARFAAYLRNQWLRTIDPLVYSTYKMKITTNNTAESYHSKMKREIGVGPSPWIFVEVILENTLTVNIHIHHMQ